jgi:multidrug efflux pump subunit AcrB
MNPGVFSVKHDRVVFIAMALVLVGGLIAYRELGRLEDPEFTIKEALIVTPYPGASAEEVALEVTNPIENACQRLGQLQRVESESVRGRSVVKAVIKDRYDRPRIPQVWDELRRKISDVQPLLPPSVRGTSMVIDDFGDVYGVFLAISGEGFTYPELRRYAEFLRRELSLVDNVKQVELFAAQQEQVFLEISRLRLARLGINEDQIYRLLQAKNVAADGGRVQVGPEYVALDPESRFRSPDDMLQVVIGSDRSGRQLTLGDVAELERDYSDPPRRILRFDGKPAIGISTVQGGNVVRMGEGIRRKLDQLKPYQPIGVQIGEINFQPEAVTEATNDFVFNLAKAVSIVVIVLLFAMGFKTGIIIGLVLFLTIMATFLVMFMKGDLLMERISLGALIIALCMLTDNAIIVIEGVKVRIEAGEDKLEVVRDVVAQNQWPLFGATAIGVLAFAAIGLSEDRTGEYCSSLFWVILIALSLSWVSSVTITPLLGFLFFKPLGGGAAGAPRDPYGGFFFRSYLRLLTLALRFRWAVVGAAVVLFVASLYGFTKVDQSFFPPATRPQFMVDVFLPAGNHIRETEAFAENMESYIKSQPNVRHVASFVGGGGLRFLLVYSPEAENRGYVQFLVEVDDHRAIDGLIDKVQKHLDEQHPNANAVAKKFLLGPGAGGRIQVRLRGPDPAKLRELADQAKTVLEGENTKGVRHDWREREKVLRPILLEAQARRNGITRVDVAKALETSFEGRVVGFYREPGHAGTGTGTYPQESRLLPIVARPPAAERSDVTALDSLQIWSPIAGRMIPLSQVVSGTELAWEDSVVVRRDRFPTITVHADPRFGFPSQLFNRVRTPIEAIELPAGYTLEWGGEYENSRDARRALARPLPYFLALMVFIVVCLFNSFRVTALIWLIMPLALIGVTAGLLLTSMPFGFMALLGVLSLAGEQIKNQIVVLSKILTEVDKGRTPYQAILEGGVSKVRPVCMVVFTTVLGMIPLLTDPFFGAMAVCIMFGLSFAAVLSLIVTPVLYAIFFGVHAPANDGKQ